jgi:hypothetical protein
MGIASRFMPKDAKDREMYAKYTSRRNHLLLLIGISLLVWILTLTFTILVLVIHGKRSGGGVNLEVDDNWFLWPIWIYITIASFIAGFKIRVTWNEFRELRNIIYPPMEKLTDENDPVTTREDMEVKLQDETENSDESKLQLKDLKAQPAVHFAGV